MTTNPLEPIAQEAVEKLHSKSCRTREDEKQIILAACEKAKQQWELEYLRKKQGDITV